MNFIKHHDLQHDLDDHNQRLGVKRYIFDHLNFFEWKLIAINAILRKQLVTYDIFV